MGLETFGKPEARASTSRRRFATIALSIATLAIVAALCLVPLMAMAALSRMLETALSHVLGGFLEGLGPALFWMGLAQTIEIVLTFHWSLLLIDGLLFLLGWLLSLGV